MARLMRLAAALGLLLTLVTPARADPLSIGIAFLVNIGYAGTITALGATIVGLGIISAGVLGASLLAGALTSAPSAKPSERQTTVRQALGPRVRFYGRVKVGGALWFFDTSTTASPFSTVDGVLYVGVTLNWGEISSVVETWLNDTECTFDGSGFILTPTSYIDELVPAVKMSFKMGTGTDTVHSDLDAAFTEVTSDHRLRGIASMVGMFKEVEAAFVSQVYPNYIPQIRIVMESSIVTSVRTGLPIYSDNAADVIYDYLTGVDPTGLAYGAGFSASQVDLASFQAFADTCDEAVDLKAGGTVARYKLAGSFALNEEMRAVLPRMLAACDADLYLTTEGKIGIRGGAFTTPTLTLDDAEGHIIDAQFRKGQSKLAAFNELTVNYTEPDLDYQEAEAQVWRDETNIALRGQVLSDDLQVLMAPNHSQARRLAKIHTAKMNPRWSGTIITNFYGLNAVGEETVTIRFSPLSIDESFLITGLRFLDDLTGVELSVKSLDATPYDWDAATEEGTGPSIPS